MKRLLLTLGCLFAFVAPTAAQVEIIPSRTTLANPTFTGQAKFADGTAAAPSISFSSDTDTGWYRVGANSIGLGLGGVNKLTIDQNGSFLAASGFYDATGVSGITPSTTGVNLVAANAVTLLLTANLLEQRNGTNAQTSRIYNTYTDASNYERGSIGWVSNDFVITNLNAGTGSARNIIIGPGAGATALFLRSGGTDRWYVNSSGHFFANIDNTYDMGATAATRPRTAHIGTSAVIAGVVTVGSTGLTVPSLGGVFAANAGALVLATTDQFGGRLVAYGSTWATATEAGGINLNTTESGSGATGGPTLYLRTAVLADAGTFLIGATRLGKLAVTLGADVRICEFELQGTGNAAVELLDGGTLCSATKDTASSTNVYYDAAGASGAGYYIQNKRGASRTYKLSLQGG